MKKILVTSVVSSTMLFGMLLASIESHAAEWTATTPESIQISEGQKSYTMEFGDTLWAISQKTNLNLQTLADLNNVNLLAGDQYGLQIGRVISFDGANVTVTESDGTIVNQATVTDENKVSSEQAVGTTVDPTAAEQNYGGSGLSTDQTITDTTTTIDTTTDTSTGESVEPTDPTEPTKPVEPTDPTEPMEPEVPEGPYVGAQLPGVPNGLVGTYTDDMALMDAMDAYKLANDLHGSEWDYLILNNGYGFYAVWVNQ